jgi:hypothetical protein
VTTPDYDIFLSNPAKGINPVLKGVPSDGNGIRVKVVLKN